MSGLNSHDRLEIYEPLWLAAEARPEHVAQRDSFWSGVVLYREKRWAEAYTEFQKARGSEERRGSAIAILFAPAGAARSAIDGMAVE